jgi:hypothetical protein
MPKAEITLDDNGVSKLFIMNLSSEDNIVLVKDKYINWKDLVSQFFSLSTNLDLNVL